MGIGVWCSLCLPRADVPLEKEEPVGCTGGDAKDNQSCAPGNSGDISHVFLCLLKLQALEKQV